MPLGGCANHDGPVEGHRDPGAGVGRAEPGWRAAVQFRPQRRQRRARLPGTGEERPDRQGVGQPRLGPGGDGTNMRCHQGGQLDVKEGPDMRGIDHPVERVERLAAGGSRGEHVGDDNPAAGTAYACHFRELDGRLGEVMHCRPAHDKVKRAVSERQRAGVAPLEQDVPDAVRRQPGGGEIQ
jgi:hypothetical protein